MTYEVRFRNHGEHTFSTTALSAEDDPQAIRLARQRFHGGIGHSYEIWHEGRLIYGDLLDPTASTRGVGQVHFNNAIVSHCIEQALACSDLQQRRLLMIFAEKMLGMSAGPHAPADRPYKAVFADAEGRPITELEIPCSDVKQAFAVAFMLADACSEACVQFELWQGQALQGSATGPFCLSPPVHLREHSRQLVIAREIMLHETCKTIAESNRLLRKLNAWFCVGAMGHA
jgi:hypothetical protein